MAVTSGTGRHRARRNAMMVLYKLDLVGPEDGAAGDASVTAAIDSFEREHGFALPDYAALLVRGVCGTLGAVDRGIEAHLTDWRLDRLGAVERAILRIGMFELVASDVPREVVIDEAIELAKRYASPEAAKLVNGVLGAWVRSHPAPPGKEQEDE